MARFAVMVLFAVAACESSSGGAGGGETGSGSAVAQAPAAKNPGGGFSADLAKKLDTAGTGSDTAPRTPSSSQAAAATTSAGGASGSAGATTASGSNSPGGSGLSGDAKAGDAKAGDAKAGDAKTGDAKAGDAKAGDAKAGDAKAGDAKAGDAKTGDAKTGDAKTAGEAKTGDVSTAPKINGAPVIGSTPKGPVTVPAELKAVNMVMLPNWERDVEGAGTISIVVKVPTRGDTASFVFQYGIEDAKAPADRDAYKKWLADNKLFVSRDDRQKGGAWYLEGVDGRGRPAFRMVVVYGGKKLICGGSLYKESPLGDLRDQTIIQAKQICESVTL